MKQGGSDNSSEFSQISPYSMTKYKHNMKKPSYLLQQHKLNPQQQKLHRDRSESERLDVSKYSSSSFKQSAQYQGHSPFINYSDNEDAQKSQRMLNIQKINQPKMMQSDKNSSSQFDQKEGGSFSGNSAFDLSNGVAETMTDSVILKSNNMNITFQDLIK